ncbi:hypothetical protein BFP97_18425 [Roseivirga sp. 4D4]|uniref:hypothetical protein n=1 Tax=Roseivirga sp. 4D4 TaxID=1889784 RepID=UPI000853E8D5|nr:hypothetical protein [Roseivirga sp. 4D4]OEK03377.1 hypothetical protein BFP97_18425 [Roseivirga sp. 4D4]
MNLKFKEDHSHFVTKLDSLIQYGQLIVTDCQIKNSYSFLKDKTTWKTQVISFLRKELLPDGEEFIKIFQRKNTDPLSEFIYDQEELSFEDLEIKVSNLSYIKNLVPMIGGLLSKSTKSKPKSIQDKLDFILYQINRDFNNLYYSIEDILYFNSIPYRDDEPEELANHLTKKKYVSQKEFHNTWVKITVTGAAYIERKTRTQETKRKSTSQKHIDQRIDEIIIRLKSLGHGQEIIFEELEELKSLNKKLSKKNWRQILQGKLVDMGIKELLDKETIGSVFEALTDEKLRLP